jgi:hypothetical protein
LHLIGREPKRSFFHFGNMVGNAGRDKPPFAAAPNVRIRP